MSSKVVKSDMSVTNVAIVYVIDRNASDAKRMWKGYGVKFGDDDWLIVKDHKTKVAKKVQQAQVFTDLLSATQALKGQKIYSVHHDGSLHHTIGFIGSDNQFYEFTSWGITQLSHGFIHRTNCLSIARKKTRATLAIRRREVRKYERQLAGLQK
jgi:hypothetical protein